MRFLAQLFVLEGGVCGSAEINGTEPFDLIEYCENHTINSEEELQEVLDLYIGGSGNTDPDEYSDPSEVISFDLTIDYDNQYVITTTVYETTNTRSSTSGYAEKKYRNNLGIMIFKVRVDGTYSYNGSTCLTTSASGSFTPTPLLGWTSSPVLSTGKSGSKAYARTHGTAYNGTVSQSYSIYLYCDVNGNLSST